MVTKSPKCGIILLAKMKGGTEVEKYYDLGYMRETPAVIALGCFDGVHKAHAAVIGEAVRIAKELSLPALVWSFSEPPKRFYSPASVSILSCKEEKDRLISELGADILLSVKFDENISSTDPEEFFYEYMLRRLCAAHIVCGYNFHFGKGGKGNTALLERLCKENSAGFTAVSSVTVGDTPVSSSAIRKLLLEGELENARELLGHNYVISSTVKHGQHLGTSLGFPTINQAFDEGNCPLAMGVYLTRIYLDSASFFGITNVGTRPTVDGKGVVAETNIFDFSGNLYGKRVRVEFLRFLRPERKFNSVDDLSARVHEDIETAKRLANEYK